MDDLNKQIKQLKSETSSYMKKRQKQLLKVAGLEILFTAFTKPFFDKEAPPDSRPDTGKIRWLIQ